MRGRRHESRSRTEPNVVSHAESNFQFAEKIENDASCTLATETAAAAGGAAIILR